MKLKKCPKCNRYSVSFDFNRGEELCHWRDCNWRNTGKIELPEAHECIITKGGLEK